MSKIEEAAVNAIDNEADAAEAASEAAKAETARNTAAAAESATAAAQAAQALTEANAAKTVQENEENVQWLKSHAQATESSLANLNERLSKQEEALPRLMEEHHNKMLESLKPLLIPAKSAEETITEVTPENEGQDDQKAAEEKKKTKPKRNWL
jgi:hypothetical protein